MPGLSTETKRPWRRPTAEGAYVDFMARAYAMENEASERYAQFAKQLDANGNGECALLFRQLAEIEDRHAKRILITMGWTSQPSLPETFDWEDSDAPETAKLDSVDYIVFPHHALELALRCEVQAQKYFEQFASGGAPHQVRIAAAEMAAEERAHARLIELWLARLPRIPGYDSEER
jgi:rubrerythrin